jgi:hypothetical protein
MTTMMGQEERSISEPLAQLDGERENAATNSLNWKSPNASPGPIRKDSGHHRGTEESMLR